MSRRDIPDFLVKDPNRPMRADPPFPDLPIVEADFNEVDERFWIPLDDILAMQDLERLDPPPKVGLKVLFVSGDQSMIGELQFEKGIWWAKDLGYPYLPPPDYPRDKNVERLNL